MTHLCQDAVDGFDDVVQEMAGIQTTCLSVSFALDVFFHHFMVQKPDTLSHVAQVASFAPNAKVKDQINDATGHSRRSGHGGIHFGKVRRDSHRTAPFDIVRKDLCVKRMNWTGWLD